MNLTPVALHEAMCFVQTVFRGNPTKPLYEDVPTAVFSTPAIGTVGLTERQARDRFGRIDVYKSRFRPLKHTLTGRQEFTLRSEEHTSELQSLMRISYAVFCLKTKTNNTN